MAPWRFDFRFSNIEFDSDPFGDLQYPFAGEFRGGVGVFVVGVQFDGHPLVVPNVMQRFQRGVEVDHPFAGYQVVVLSSCGNVFQVNGMPTLATDGTMSVPLSLLKFSTIPSDPSVAPR